MYVGRFLFFRILLIGFIIVLFVKIYQHNLIVKLNYRRQRVERMSKNLKKERNELLANFFQLQDHEKIIAQAVNERGMRPLNVSQVITLTAHAGGRSWLMTSTKVEGDMSC